MSFWYLSLSIDPPALFVFVIAFNDKFCWLAISHPGFFEETLNILPSWNKDSSFDLSTSIPKKYYIFLRSLISNSCANFFNWAIFSVISCHYYVININNEKSEFTFWCLIKREWSYANVVNKQHNLSNHALGNCFSFFFSFHFFPQFCSVWKLGGIFIYTSKSLFGQATQNCLF